MRKNVDAGATYTLLKDDEHEGSWAVWLNALPESEIGKGKRVSVTTKSGNVRLERLVEQLWVNDDGSLQLWLIEDSGECKTCGGQGATERQQYVNDRYGKDYRCPACEGTGKVMIDF
jgi:hypothetical protein